MPSRMKLEIIVEMGVTNLGKYTFPKIPAFPVKTLETLNIVVLKYPQSVFPAK